MSSSRDWSDDTGSLRRFGLALARDDRFVLDDASASRLVDKLIRQTSLTLIDEKQGPGSSARVWAFGRFIHLYRRYVRKLALEDADAHWSEGPAVPGRVGAVSAGSGVRALPLELRESLLLVALAGFSHEHAAEALDIPLTRLLERLDHARGRLADLMTAPGDPSREPAWRGAPHLRVIK